MHTHHLASVALSRRITIVLTSIVAALCAFAAHAGDLRVIVLTPIGQPSPDAIVCAGTPQNPVQYGTTAVNPSGVAVLRNLPMGAVQVTAHSGQSGYEQVHQMGPTPQQSITIRLPSATTRKTCGAQVNPVGTVNPQLGGSQQPPAPVELKLGKVRPPTERLQLGSHPRLPVKTEYCFGALGAQCGGAQHNLSTTALCAGGYCQINAGSWEHDECCFKNSQGLACQAGPLDYAIGHNGACEAQWNKALARLTAGLNWTRRIDYNKPNTTGRVEFAAYCAPTGTRVLQEDVRYCCSRQADPIPIVPGVPSALRACR